MQNLLSLRAQFSRGCISTSQSWGKGMTWTGTTAYNPVQTQRSVKAKQNIRDYCLIAREEWLIPSLLQSGVTERQALRTLAEFKQRLYV